MDKDNTKRVVPIAVVAAVITGLVLLFELFIILGLMENQLFQAMTQFLRIQSNMVHTYTTKRLMELIIVYSLLLLAEGEKAHIRFQKAHIS